MIILYTAATPNGKKVSICLEEMKLPYEVKVIDLQKGEQKEEPFLKICPNGRIPAITDTEQNFHVFESGAILVYLAEKTGHFYSDDPFKRSRIMQWLMFQMAGVGPMRGQLNVFSMYFNEHLPSVIERYQRESLRLCQVLNSHLEKQPFLADDLSIADFATYPWVYSSEVQKIDISDFKHLEHWYETLSQRKGVQKGMRVPPDLDDDTRVALAKNMLV